jgi:hypothetical protein
VPEAVRLPPKWKYTTHPPSQTHRDLRETVYLGHRMGWKKRKNQLGPEIGYKVYCQCGWKDTIWVPFRLMQVRYDKQHIDKVKEQGTLC